MFSKLKPGAAAAAHDNAVAKHVEAMQALKAAEEALDAHEDARPDGSDLEKLVAWKRELQDLEIRADAADEALEFAKQRVDELAADIVLEKAARRYDAAAALIPAHAELASEIARDAVLLAEKLGQLENMRRSIEAANQVAEQLKRPTLIDGERQARTEPEQTLPELAQEVEGWFDQNGRHPLAMTTDATGRQVPANNNMNRFSWQKVRQVIRREQRIPARMPKRFAETFRLFNLSGDAIWPPVKAAQ